MKVIASITGVPYAEIGRTVTDLEAAGFAGITTQENRFNPFLPLSIAAVESSELELRTSVAIAFPRSPMVTANLAWDLQSASNGRFVLGLGSQVRGHNVRRFGVPWSAPAPRMREYVQALRAIWDCWQNGTPLDYRGDHYQLTLMTPNFAPPPLTVELPKVHLAAVGPAMMKVAAQVADGVMLHPFSTRRYIESAVLPRLRETLAAGGRDAEDFSISGGGFVATGPDDDAVRTSYEWVRSRIGFYGSTPAYRPVLQAHGWEALGERLNALSKAGRWPEMTEAVPDQVVDAFVAVGRYDTIADAIAQRFGGLVDTVALPADVPARVVEAVGRI